MGQQKVREAVDRSVGQWVRYGSFVELASDEYDLGGQARSRWWDWRLKVLSQGLGQVGRHQVKQF